MKINNVDMPFELLDADQAEKAEKAINEATITFNKKSEEMSNMTASQSIRAQCQIIFDCFDNIFGVDAHKKIFGSKTNIGTCLMAFEQFVNELQAGRAREMKKLSGRIVDKYK